MSASSKSLFIKKGRISFPMETQSPFLFGVYHKDLFPPGDARMQSPRRGNGADFDQNAPYRMYHGDRIPGFPQHPHRGFETITCTIQGIIDHTDSLGCGGRYGNGDLQWMTAGAGIVHGEMFPLINDKSDNPTRFFQLWLNLPRTSKMVRPTQKMHWSDHIPHYTTDGVDVTVWAGSFNGITALPPPPDSYASDPRNCVRILFVKVSKGAGIVLPQVEDGVRRSLYVVDALFGERADAVVRFGGGENVLKVGEYAFLGKDECRMEYVDGSDEFAWVLVLEGRMIDEPVVQHGPFVMNSQQEIQQAFADYRQTRFGGWPWDDDAVVFPRERGRFLQIKGKEVEYPPSSSDSNKK